MGNGLGPVRSRWEVSPQARNSGLTKKIILVFVFSVAIKKNASTFYLNVLVVSKLGVCHI